MINLLGARLVCLTIAIGLACLMADQCGPAGTAGLTTTSKCIACSTQHSSAQAGTDTDGGDETNDYHRCV